MLEETDARGILRNVPSRLSRKLRSIEGKIEDMGDKKKGVGIKRDTGK